MNRSDRGPDLSFSGAAYPVRRSALPRQRPGQADLAAARSDLPVSGSRLAAFAGDGGTLAHDQGYRGLLHHFQHALPLRIGERAAGVQHPVYHQLVGRIAG